MNKDVIPAQPPQQVSAWRAQRGFWFFSAVFLGLFLLLAGAVALVGMPSFAFEPDVSQAVQEVDLPYLKNAMQCISWPGDSALWFSVFVGISVLVLLIGKEWLDAAILLAVVLLGQTIKVGFKDLIKRPRPPRDGLIVIHENFGFPSGHTVLYTVFFGFLCYLTITQVKNRAVRWLLVGWLLFMIVTISISRIYLKAHWLTDTLAGYLLGGAIVAAGIGLERVWRGKV